MLPKVFYSPLEDWRYRVNPECVCVLHNGGERKGREIVTENKIYQVIIEIN